MKNIGGFFAKFRNKAISEINNYSIAIEVIKKYTKINLEIKDISIGKGVITIKNPSSEMTNEIFIKKQSILKEISQKLGSNKIFDIK